MMCDPGGCVRVREERRRRRREGERREVTAGNRCRISGITTD